MNLATTGLAAFAMIGAAAYVAHDAGESAGIAESAGAVRVASTAEYRITGPRDGTECTLERGTAGKEGHARLVLSRGCAASAPQLAAASYWVEEERGAVALADGAGNTLVRFARADGVGWESFEPASLILYLDPLD